MNNGEAKPTVSHMLGEIVWLLTQSPLHRGLAIGDVEWLVMPALLHEQYYVFREGATPVGCALWAKCNVEAEAKLENGLLDPANRLTASDWNSGDRIWLVDLVAPFASEANRQKEVMVADLISGPLKGQAFKFHRTQPDGGKTSVTIGADAAERLADAVKTAVQAADNPAPDA